MSDHDRIDLPELQSITFGMDSFKFSKWRIENNQLIMRSLFSSPES